MTAAGEPRAPAYAPIVLWDRTPERMVFHAIPPGEFRMGSRGCDADEEPRHRVRIAAPQDRADVPPFWMAKTPVTQAQLARWTGSAEYEAWFVREAEARALQGKHVNHFADKPSHPAENLSWWEAVGFCEWLGRSAVAPLPRPGLAALPEGWTLRASLPSEAYWEYACRAGTDTEYGSGSGEEALRRVGWFGEKWDEGGAHPVGRLEPNAWGLFDVHGNVWEWCVDPWDEHAYRGRLDGDDAPVPQADLSSSADRVYRGGSWLSTAWGCRSANRIGWGPSDRLGDLGFRVCLLPGPVVLPAGSGSPSSQAAQAPEGDARGGGTPTRRSPQGAGAAEPDPWHDVPFPPAPGAPCARGR